MYHQVSANNIKSAIPVVTCSGFGFYSFKRSIFIPINNIIELSKTTSAHLVCLTHMVSEGAVSISPITTK